MTKTRPLLLRRWAGGLGRMITNHSTRTGLPQFELRRLIAVLIETRIANPAKVVVIGLPFDARARESFLLVIQGEHILKDIEPFPFPQPGSVLRRGKSS